MADKQQLVIGPDNKYYQFPSGTTKDQAISYFKKRGIGVPHGVSGSWEPEHPTFFQGLSKSMGIPSGQEVTSYLSSAYHHPVDTAVDTAKTAAAVTKFAVKHPGKFLWAMTNVPQIREAYRNGNYAETAGLLVGTLGQAAVAFFAEEGLIPKAMRLTDTIAGGGTVGDFFKSEQALKASRATERAQQIYRLANSVKLKITPGERLAGGRLESAERSLRGFPGIAGPYRKIANQRKDAILAMRDSLGAESEAMKGSAQALYNAIGKSLPGFAEKYQEPIKQLRTELRTARASNAEGAAQLSYNIQKKLEDTLAETNKVIQRSKNPVAISAWQHADSLWRRYHAKIDLRDVIEHNVIGFTAQRLQRFGETAEAPRPQELQSLVKDLTPLDRDGTLREALGDKRATELLRVASLYDRVRQTGKGYIAERLLGYGIIGALPFINKDWLHGYAFDVAVGAAGGMLLSWAFMRFGSTTEVFENFLKSVERGDMFRARSLARSLAAHADMVTRNEQARQRPPTTPMGPMSESERLRISVPLSLQPIPGEDPLRDMLSRLLDELTVPPSGPSEEQLRSGMEREASKKRSRFREAESLAEA